jgi:hypothetical protein
MRQRFQTAILKRIACRSLVLIALAANAAAIPIHRPPQTAMDSYIRQFASSSRIARA